MTTATDEIQREELIASRGMYGLLARHWLAEPDRALLEELSRPPLGDLYLQAGGAIPEAYDQRVCDELAIDLCQLFLGPTGHLPPCQSVWESGQFGSAAVASMQRFIDLTGYELPSWGPSAMADHLAVQFDVMRHLHERLLADSLDSANRGLLLDVRQTYFATHLTWPDRFLKAASGRAQTNFYRALISLTRAFLATQTTTNAPFKEEGVCLDDVT